MENVVRTSPKNSPHKNAFVTSASSGANQIVAAVAGMRYRVLSVVAVATAANSIKFQSASTDISATWPLGANGGFVLPFNEHGWFETNAGEALNVNFSAATSTGVQVHYIPLI